MADQINSRLLPWTGCFNIRDLGGYPLVNGGETIWRSLVRGDSLCRLDENGMDALVKFGVRSIIDLRGPLELSKAPHPFADHRRNGGVRYVNLPVMDDDNQAVMNRINTAQSTAEVYAIMLEGFADQFLAVLHTILETEEGAVLFHCHAGKDRTGIVAALLLELAGVSEQVIIDDYALTDQYIDVIYQEATQSAPEDPQQRERYLRRLNAHPEKMAGFLRFLRERYNGTTGFLRENGWSDEVIAALNNRLTSPR